MPNPDSLTKIAPNANFLQLCECRLKMDVSTKLHFLFKKFLDLSTCGTID